MIALRHYTFFGSYVDKQKRNSVAVAAALARKMDDAIDILKDGSLIGEKKAGVYRITWIEKPWRK